MSGGDVDVETGGSSDADPDPMEDAEAWQELDREEQSEILDEGLADLKGDRGEGSFRHLDEDEQEETIDAIERPTGGQPDRELSETEQAMQAALEETWTAELFRGLDDVPTVPFECQSLTAEQWDRLQEAIQYLMQVEEDAAPEGEQEGDLEELDIDGTHFESVDALDEWIPQFLADVTTDPAFDEARFRSGEGLRQGTRQELLLEIFEQRQEETERAVKFRAE